jgi:cytochrome c oxidase subunit 3
MMTGLHMLHVFVGLVILATLLVLTMKGKFNAQYSTPIEIGGLYWHLVDLIWIYLFPLLYLIA